MFFFKVFTMTKASAEFVLEVFFSLLLFGITRTDSWAFRSTPKTL